MSSTAVCRQPQHAPLLLLDPQEINVPFDDDSPYLPPPEPDPDPDLLEHPELDAGTDFRHSGWAGNRRRVASAIVEKDGYGSRFARFAACGAGAWVSRDASRPLGYQVRASFCHDRFCVPCAATRGHRIASNILAMIGDAPVQMITLTIRSGPGDALTDLLAKLYRSFARLRRDPWWKTRMPGGVAVLEVKFCHDTNHWHPHLHVLAHGKPLDNDALSATWLHITKDSWVTNVRHDVGQVQTAYYVTKYVSKPGDGSVMRCEHLLAEMLEALHHRRLCSTFGTWRGIPIFQPGEPVEWIFVDTLASIRWRARNGDVDALTIMRVIAGKPDADADSAPLLPYPDP